MMGTKARRPVVYNMQRYMRVECSCGAEHEFMVFVDEDTLDMRLKHRCVDDGVVHICPTLEAARKELERDEE